MITIYILVHTQLTAIIKEPYLINIITWSHLKDGLDSYSLIQIKKK